MSKENSPKKPFTQQALEAAEAQVEAAKKTVTNADREFETGGRTSELYQRSVAARDELAFHVRVFDLAAAEHAAYERNEADRVAYEAEQQRLEQLAEVNAEIDQNIAASSRAGEALARGLRIGWDLAIKSQGLGGSGSNGWAHDVQDAIGRALVAEGINNTRLIRVA